MTILGPGALVAERYAIVDRIGEGGMGVVYSARDEKLRRTVAIKVLSPARVGNKTARARLKREARAAAAFDDPGIAQVYDFGETPDGGAFLVMELVRGKSVRAMLPGIQQTEALRIVREVARTLDAAHRVDLIHRDVKPDNIMIREDGRVVLLDFGLAKELSTAPRPPSQDADKDPDSVVTAQGTMVGTPPYVAPEQIHGKNVGPASDQFALAVVAFGLLTGKKPWDSMSDLGMLGQILTEPPRTATSLAPSLPKGVDPVFERALSKEAKMRYPSVEAFADALEIAVTGKPIAARAVPTPEAAPAKKEPAPEKTPAPEPTPFFDLDVPVNSPVNVPATMGPEAPSSPPAAYQRPVWKIRESEEPPPSSMAKMVVIGVIIAVVAAAAGVWYGRRGATPQGGAPSRDVGQGR